MIVLNLVFKLSLSFLSLHMKRYELDEKIKEITAHHTKIKKTKLMPENS
jgi:hypothetical protein